MSSEQVVQQVLSSTNDTGKATVTVLYYEAPVGLEMHNAVLYDLDISQSGRVIIPDDFRVNKSIIAVLDGECRILNSLGERVYSQKVVAE
ncbi:TIGR02922 family protein [Shewanella sp. WXL01]|uniref:TIGR02922 family protein n=1 Tax=Shewanella maritima TaxID=2520507 RepID=A0A411PEN8_9GAMM|nr:MULTISPECIES: TIGR02922 family protein [Shewanella]NKF49948.1 TIGR02922 family protein [Shewanella sp. WXL01]QBF81995.1 TIGR02922 family protein [Shewanella maritima]